MNEERIDTIYDLVGKVDKVSNVVGRAADSAAQFLSGVSDRLLEEAKRLHEEDVARKEAMRQHPANGGGTDEDPSRTTKINLIQSFLRDKGLDNTYPWFTDEDKIDDAIVEYGYREALRYFKAKLDEQLDEF